MRAHTAAIVVGAADCVAAVAIALALLGSGSDPATKDLDNAAAWLLIALLLISGVPGLVLALLRRAPKFALVLTLGFPIGFVLFYIAAVIAFAF